MPGAHPGSTSGVDPVGQGGIPRQFKQKKNCCDTQTQEQTNKRMDRHVDRNRDLDNRVSFLTFIDHRIVSSK